MIFTDNRLILEALAAAAASHSVSDVERKKSVHQDQDILLSTAAVSQLDDQQSYLYVMGEWLLLNTKDNGPSTKALNTPCSTP